jgi:UDP-GlcNAc:undecaprenyl-phosphate/decaprenyl-phosphate GlcNAc-1-phosphate transferase
VLHSLGEFLRHLGIAAPSSRGWLTVVLAIALGAVAAWWFMPRVRLFALQVGWADEPNSRRLNREPLPNAGGLAIFASVVLAVIIPALLRGSFKNDVEVQVLSILLGATFLIIAGFIDDQFGLPPYFRLIVQLAAAMVLITHGIRIHAFFGGNLATAASILITLVWIIGITNAVNLIDGVDGLAGGVTFITAMSLLAVSAQFPDRAAATVLLAALAGATLGFLRHNFPPSRIIMGDSGAYFVGFILAASSILGAVKTTAVFSLFPALLFLLLPVLDTTQVLVRRLVSRRNPLSSPGKDHLHHGLLARGFSQTRTTIILWIVTLATCVLAMAVQGMSLLIIGLTVVAIAILLAFIVWRRRRALRLAQLRKRSAAQASTASTAGDQTARAGSPTSARLDMASDVVASDGGEAGKRSARSHEKR